MAGHSTLPSTIPEVEHEIAHKSYITVFDVDGRTQSADIFCDVIAKHN